MTLERIQADLFTRRPENKIDIKLDRMYNVLKILGNPQNVVPVIHIAGTNGKSSTCKYIAALLASQHKRVGVYTSPHLISVLERIQVVELSSSASEPEFENLTQELFVEIYDEVIKVADSYEAQHPSHGKFGFFEIATIIAFVAFSRLNLDYVVLEVGLGGRYDATNVVRNVLAAVITPIDIDHVAFLGDDIKQIAYEKAGIMKSDLPVFVAKQALEVQLVIDRCAHEIGAKQVLVPSSDSNYLKRNFLLASAVANHLLGSKQKDMQHLFETVQIPGRLQKVATNPDIMVDAAHNPHGVKSLGDAINAMRVNIKSENGAKNGVGKSGKYHKVVAICAGFNDKDFESYMQVLSSFTDIVIVTQNSSARSLTVDQLKEIASHYFNYEQLLTAPNIPEAVAHAREVASELKSGVDGENALILATGSVVTAGEVIEFLS